MRSPPQPQDDDRDDVYEQRYDDDDNNEHHREVETNSGESNGANEIKGADIKETYEIEEI